jgi:hypothetical protein
VADLQVGDPSPHVDEVVRLPRDLLAGAGARSADHRLTVLLTRQRADQHEPIRSDPELSISRTFSLPTARTFTVSGTARISGVAPDAAIDAALGTASGGLTATASDRLPGEPAMRAAAAVDGDPTTAWQTPIGVVTGQALTVRSPTPVTFDHLDLTVFADGRHSVPTALAIAADGGAPVTVPVPAIADDPAHENAAVTVRVPLPAPVTASSLDVGIAAIRAQSTIDYISERPVDLPVAVAELGVPGLRAAAPEAALPGSCRTDLVTVDGQPVPVRVTGSGADATARLPLAVTACGPPLVLGPGPHDVRTAVGRDVGIDVDRVVLDSAAPAAAPAPGAAPTLTVTGRARVSYDGRVDGATQPFWLVLGQSLNAGWHARVGGHDLGPATLVDGYANGWRVTPPPGGGPLVFSLEWTPQRWVWRALAVSAVVTLICLVLVALDRRRIPGPADDERGPRTGPRAPAAAVVALVAGAGLLFGAVAGVAAGALAALTAVAGSLLPRRGRRLLGLVPAALLALAAAYIVAKSIRYPIPGDADWPPAFSATDGLAWGAVAVAVTLVAVQAVRDRSP